MSDDTITLDPPTLEPIRRLDRDVRQAMVKLLSPQEVRWAVDLYYQTQNYRIRASNQVRSLKDGEEPSDLLRWGFDTYHRVESEIKKAMHDFAQNHRPGRWLLSIHGIGPVLAAGLLAHIDITQAPVAGKIWRLAGYDNTHKWLKEKEAKALVNQYWDPKDPKGTIVKICAILRRRPESWVRLCTTKTGKITKRSIADGLKRRPYNQKLQTLCWKVGQSFMKQRNSDKDYYGKIYAERKAEEIRRNKSGMHKGYELKLKNNVTKIVDELPDFIVDARARRYAVKFFLSHLQHVMWEDRFGQPPPKPYVIAHMNHVDYVAPPNWPCE